MGWDLWNLVATVGAFVIAVGILVFMANVWLSLKAGEPAGDDPWDARTLEWTTTSPPPAHNFDVVPTVTHLDELWHRKYAGEEVPHRVPSGASADHAEASAESEAHNIHLPDPSYWPLVVALGMPIASWGVVFRLWAVVAIGLLITVFGMLAWGLEPSSEPHDHSDHA
jgi:cytochrome c oxidase subunit 1